ncbi:MAG TPA: DnaA/Hda family protein [Planctomycetota bacterium]|nr:DnaA/Hda family protein [Planctomycetota bacterium]
MAWALDAVWRRLNHELFRDLGPDRYSLWIRHARPATLDEELFTIHFASTHAKDKVESMLRDAVTAAAQRATNRNVRVLFTVEGDSFPGAADAPPPPRSPSFATFVAGPGSRTALAAARGFVRGGAGAPRILLIHAPSGMGRTHLLRAIHAELSRRPDAGALFFTGEQFRRHSREAHLRDRREAFLKKCRSAPVFLFDDLHLLSSRDDAQAALADVLGALAGRGARAALTCEKHPRHLDRLHKALRARLRADVEVTIDRPDVPTGKAVLRAAAPMDVPDAVLDYVAEHVRSSHADQLECLDQVLARTPFTLASARSAVSEFLNRWSLGLRFEDIVRAAADDFGVTVTEIYSLDRSREAAEARQACFYLARKLLGRPFAQIGDHFGGRDHSTVHEACRKMEAARGEARERLLRLEERLQPKGG